MGRLLAIALLLCGCRQLLGFETVTGSSDAPSGGDDAPLLDDSFVPDASACTAVESECVGAPAMTLRTCSTVGELPVDTQCPWGCVASSTAHCAQLQPAGGVIGPADLEAGPSVLGDVTITTDGNTVLDTVAGSITNVRPGGVGTMAGIDFETRNGFGIFRVNSLVIDGAGVNALQLRGTNGLVIVAVGSITIRAPLDATVGCGMANNVVGGSRGGSGSQDGFGQGGGKKGQGGGDKTSGGGGGGYGARGSDGGASNQGGSLGGVGGASYGDPQITMLVGGSGGGGVNNGTGSLKAGSGGAAIQLAANGTIRFDSGGINAGGCGGNGSGQGGGAGGGAGGTILLEAPIVSLAAATFLAANGGAGAGDSTTLFAENGKPSNQAAHGTNGSTGGNGGDGGADIALMGTLGLAGQAGGGGGGAVGRIRIDTLSATTLQLSTDAVVSPALMTPAASTGSATVQ